MREGWTVDCVVDAANRTTFFFFFFNGTSVLLKRMARRQTEDGSYAWRLFDRMNDDQKPVVMFRLNQDTLNGKELSLNVI